MVGVSALAATLSDFTILGSDHGQLFLSSPLETPEVQDGLIDASGLGGADLHASRSGIASLVADSEAEACDLVAMVLSHFPDHHDAVPPHLVTSDPHDRTNEPLLDIVPDNPNRPYDMTSVIREVVDEGEFLEISATYAENILIGLGRIGGRPVGIIGNQPKVLAGCLDIDASIKVAFALFAHVMPSTSHS